MDKEWSNAVIVVGAGLSGAAAALTAVENGVKVILVEKEKKAGGNSVRASSGINAAGTIHQKQQGIKDSVELFAHDTAFSCVKDINAKPTDMIMTLCENSAESVHWLDKQNIQLPVLSQCGGHSASRTHRPTTGAAGGYMTLGLIQKIKLAQDAGKVKMIKEAKMTKLLKNKAGKVNGIEYESTKDKTKHTIHGSSVIIATGGFCFNENMIKQYGPHLIDLPTTNGPWARGEGMLVANEVGAQLVDMELIQVHPTGFIKPDHPNEKEKILAAECLRAAGALLINKDGHRFVNELGHRDDVTAAIRGQSGPIRILLNPTAVKEVAPHVKMYKDFFKVLWTYPNGKALADEMKIPVENLQDTFQTYNLAAKKGWCPSSKDRFPAVPFDINQELTIGFVTPVLHYVMGGIKINTKAQALCADDKPIEGLFACGETTGGVHGRNRLAGNSLVDCVVYGRIAGKSASIYAKSSKL